MERLMMLVVFGLFLCSIDTSAQQFFIGYDKSGNRLQFGEDRRPELALSSDTLRVEYTDTTAYIVVTNVGLGTLNWLASTELDWLTLREEGNLSGDTLFLDVAQNTLKEVRSGEVFLIDDDSLSSAVSAHIIQQELPNKAPVVDRPIDDLFLITGFNEFKIDLDTVFSDPDDSELNYAVEFNTQNVIDTEVSSSGVLSIIEFANGVTDLYVQASDNFGGVTYDTLSVDVSLAAILQVSTDTIKTINVGGTYEFDISNGSQEAMNWEVISNSDWITLEGETSGVNDATLSLRVSSNPLRIKRTGSITVSSDNARNESIEVFVAQEAKENSLPTTLGIEDLSLVAGFATSEITLTDFFDDADNDELSFQSSLSSDDVVNIEITDGVAAISEEGEGRAEWYLQADDGFGGVAYDTVNIEVQGVAIIQVDREAIELQSAKSIDILRITNGGTKEFSWQVSTEDEWISFKSIVNNGKGGQVLFQASENLSDQNRVGTISIVSSETENERIDVEITQLARPNTAPTQVREFQDYDLNFNFEEIVLDLSSYFNDADGDLLTYSLENSNEAVVDARISEGLLEILPSDDVGEAVITLRVTDGFEEIQSSINFKVVLVAGVDVSQRSSYINVYPNPVSEILNYQVGSELGILLEMRLIDQQGKELRVVKKPRKEGYIDIKELPPGLLMLHFITSKGEFVEKIIKTH